jgi:AcrR family transcriptional regulator
MKQLPIRKRAPGRPREFDRAVALDIAMRLFWRHGYEGTSIARLTAAMGINAPSLYATFGSKEQLYRDALRLYLGSIGRIGVSTLDQSPSARQAVAGMLKEAAIAFTRPDYPPGCMVGIGALRCADENKIAVQETAALRRMAQQAIERRIVQAVSDGELPPEVNATDLAAFYAAVVEGLSVQAQDGASAEQLHRIGDTAMNAWPTMSNQVLSDLRRR